MRARRLLIKATERGVRRRSVNLADWVGDSDRLFREEEGGEGVKELLCPKNVCRQFSVCTQMKKLCSLKY